MTRTYVLTGEARPTVVGIGPADAEHVIEKAVRSRSPDCDLLVLQVRRLSSESRIAQEFELRCRLRMEVSVDAETIADGRRTALRTVRRVFDGTPLSNVVWESPKLREETHAEHA